MGLWKKLFGGADGIRETMRETYARHWRAAYQKPGYTSLQAHEEGLFGALGSRYQARGHSVAEPALWGDLVPFLGMTERRGVYFATEAFEAFEAVEALAEYAVVQEAPGDARRNWLCEVLSDGLRSFVKYGDDERLPLISLGAANRAPWIALLDQDPTSGRACRSGS